MKPRTSSELYQNLCSHRHTERPQRLAIYGLMIVLATCAAIALMSKAEAQGITTTRTSSYDFQCQNANGAKISDHQRFDSAFIACLNDSRGTYVAGGRYRINRPVTPPPPPPVNRAPTIAGTPAASVVAGSAYSFAPSAADADSDPLSFVIANRPAWATFSTATGLLNGTPTDTGTHSNVSISVSDGKATAALAPFSITVTTKPSAPGAATLAWTPPTQNTDGTALTNLAGYSIHYGTSSGALSRTISVNSASTSQYVIEGLAPGTWYFAMRAITSAGSESTLSSITSKLIQ